MLDSIKRRLDDLERRATGRQKIVVYYEGQTLPNYDESDMLIKIGYESEAVRRAIAQGREADL